MALLPLFPLDLVLFPGATLPLHVFEPRYKEMIGECLEQKLSFGVVRAQENAIAEVGCTAEIIEVSKRYDDGRLDIITEGRRRFQVTQLDEERAFLRGELDYFDDEPAAAAPAQVEDAIRLHLQLMALITNDQPELDPADPLLSFQLAADLPLDLDFKQTMLGMRSEAERIPALVKYFEAILPRMQRAVKARHKAGGNGHAI